MRVPQHSQQGSLHQPANGTLCQEAYRLLNHWHCGLLFSAENDLLLTDDQKGYLLLSKLWIFNEKNPINSQVVFLIFLNILIDHSVILCTYQLLQSMSPLSSLCHPDHAGHQPGGGSLRVLTQCGFAPLVVSAETTALQALVSPPTRERDGGAKWLSQWSGKSLLLSSPTPPPNFAFIDNVLDVSFLKFNSLGNLQSCTIVTAHPPPPPNGWLHDIDLHLHCVSLYLTFPTPYANCSDLLFPMTVNSAEQISMHLLVLHKYAG